ncbi:hypothetical protein G6L30_12035 [Agrobacterium rhizogenes]|nr:hypothetical protein [Rhizobium rhizogenes]
MRIRNEVVAALNAALTSDDRVPLIEQEITNGCTLQEIERAFAGSKWRFHLYKSGLRIDIADVNELRKTYTDALDALKTMCVDLLIQDKTISKPWDAFPQIRIRTDVARQARKVTLVEARANRFLSGRERLNADGSDPIATLLQSFGFKWTGGDIVLELDKGECPALRRATRDRGEAQTSNRLPVKKEDHTKTLSALRSAANGDNEKDVTAKLDRVLHGVPLHDIANVLKHTDFRYELLASGKSFRIQKFSDLGASFKELCGEVFELKMALGADNPKADHGFRSLNIREPLGVACKELSIEADRLNRYLLPSEQHLEAGDYVTEILGDSEFRWNGDYEVERFESENKHLLEAAIVYYSSPPIADAPGLH